MGEVHSEELEAEESLERVSYSLINSATLGVLSSLLVNQFVDGRLKVTLSNHLRIDLSNLRILKWQ